MNPAHAVKPTHVVGDIHFTHGSNVGTMECAAGDWSGPTDRFWEHRQSLGLRTPHISHSIRSDVYPGTFARKDPRTVAA